MIISNKHLEGISILDLEPISDSSASLCDHFLQLCLETPSRNVPLEVGGDTFRHYQ